MTSSDLQSMNSSTLGAQFPVVTLPDGTQVQTGTVGALLTNVKRYNTLQASLRNVPATKPHDRADIKAQLEGLEEAFRMAVPLLVKVGMFDLFPVSEWVAAGGKGGEENPGRKRVGELAEVWMREKEKEKEK